MLEVIVKGEEIFDEDKNEFVPSMEPHTLKLEHSLLSIAKWEEKYHKAFLSTELDLQMTIDYIRCMTINNVPNKVYDYITPAIIDQVTEYIKDRHTASYINGDHSGVAHKNGSMLGEKVTAEIVYYWMISMDIPVEFQKWHLNRLLMLIRIISIKNDPKGGKGQKLTASQRKAINQANRARFHTKG